MGALTSAITISEASGEAFGGRLDVGMDGGSDGSRVVGVWLFGGTSEGCAAGTAPWHATAATMANPASPATAKSLLIFIVFLPHLSYFFCLIDIDALWDQNVPRVLQKQKGRLKVSPSAFQLCVYVEWSILA
jgi:hypothetical protein